MTSAARRPVLLSLALSLAPALAPAPRARSQDVDHVIGPGHEAALLAIAGGDAEIAGCRVTGVEVARDHVEARYACGARTPRIVLWHPRGRRDATIAGSFAIEPSSDAPAELVEAVAARASASREPVWSRIPRASTPIAQHAAADVAAAIAATLLVLAAIAIAIERRAPRLAPAVWTIASFASIACAIGALIASAPPPRAAIETALVIVLAHLAWALAGLAAGRALRVLRPTMPVLRAGAILAAALVTIAALAGASIRALSVYDAYLGAALATLASLLGLALPGLRGGTGEPVGLGRAALAIGSLALAIGAAEIAARALGLPVDARGSLRWMHLSVADADREWQASALFPEARDREWFARGPADLDALRRDPAIRRVVHVGDSMVLGAEVADDEHFTRLLEQARPGEEHLNLGISNVGTDVYLVVVRRWIARLDPDSIVVHVFDNDLREIDQRYASCGGGPWIDWDDPALPERCGAEPRWELGPRLRHALDPPPAAIRALGLVSPLASALGRTLERARPSRLDDGPESTREDHARRALAAIREITTRRGVALRVVAMPRRPRSPDDPSLHTRMIAAARAAGLEVLDPGEELASEEFFQPEIWNPHLDAAGHARLARWLAPRLDP